MNAKDAIQLASDLSKRVDMTKVQIICIQNDTIICQLDAKDTIQLAFDLSEKMT